MNAVADHLASESLRDKQIIADGVAKHVAFLRHAGKTRTTVLGLLSEMDIQPKDLVNLTKIRDLLDTLTQVKDWKDK